MKAKSPAVWPVPGGAGHRRPRRQPPLVQNAGDVHRSRGRRRPARARSPGPRGDRCHRRLRCEPARRLVAVPKKRKRWESIDRALRSSQIAASSSPVTDLSETIRPLRRQTSCSSALTQPTYAPSPGAQRDRPRSATARPAQGVSRGTPRPWWMHALTQNERVARMVVLAHAGATSVFVKSSPLKRSSSALARARA